MTDMEKEAPNDSKAKESLGAKGFYRFDIEATCRAVQNAVKGGRPEGCRNLVSWLEMRLKHWQWGPREKDVRIHDLIESTLKEWKSAFEAGKP